MRPCQPFYTATLLLLGCLSLPVWGDDVDEAEDPCITLHKMGDERWIYNDSNYDWNVIFTTNYYSGLFNYVNAGAVKFSNDGKWIDNGTGDYRNSKQYKIPVPRHQYVKIVYCASSSRDVLKIHGTVKFEPVASEQVPHTPQGNVMFSGGGGDTPAFENLGNTSHVNFNRNPMGVFEYGSLTICPNDPKCERP